VRLAWVVLLAGCDQVFGLSPVADALPESACAAPDEDDDCIVNDVDNCPGIPNSEQLDGDNDAIGDDCDPMPMLAGDRRVRFFAFDDPSEADAFVDLTVNGKWVHAPGEMRHSETMDNNASLHSETASTSTFFAIEAATSKGQEGIRR
jgi:hypothetical protein